MSQVPITFFPITNCFRFFIISTSLHWHLCSFLPEFYFVYIFGVAILRLQWKGINCKQSTRWQHLSQLKASAFFSLQKKFCCYTYTLDWYCHLVGDRASLELRAVPLCNIFTCKRYPACVELSQPPKPDIWGNGYSLDTYSTAEVFAGCKRCDWTRHNL